MMNAFGVVLIAVGLALVGSAPGWVFAQSAATGESVPRVAPLDPDQAITLAQRRIRRHPHDAGAYHRLGDAYIQKARASGDLTYLDRAEQGLRRSLALSPHFKINLDIGHFTAANYDAVAYLRQQHANITNLHVKDRRKNQGDNVPWGQGDTPITQVLQLL